MGSLFILMIYESARIAESEPHWQKWVSVWSRYRGLRRKQRVEGELIKCCIFTYITYNVTEIKLDFYAGFNSVSLAAMQTHDEEDQVSALILLGFSTRFFINSTAPVVVVFFISTWEVAARNVQIVIFRNCFLLVHSISSIGRGPPRITDVSWRLQYNTKV